MIPTAAMLLRFHRFRSWRPGRTNAFGTRGSRCMPSRLHMTTPSKAPPPTVCTTSYARHGTKCLGSARQGTRGAGGVGALRLRSGRFGVLEEDHAVADAPLAGTVDPDYVVLLRAPQFDEPERGPRPRDAVAALGHRDDLVSVLVDLL